MSEFYLLQVLICIPNINNGIGTTTRVGFNNMHNVIEYLIENRIIIVYM